MIKGTIPNRWSEDEVAKLMRLYLKFRTVYRKWDRIAAELPGRTRTQCAERVRYQFHGRQVRTTHAPSKQSAGLGSHYVAPPVVTPASVWADAQLRNAMSRPNITAEFFGDPLPGYSALDRRS